MSLNFEVTVISASSNIRIQIEYPGIQLANQITVNRTIAVVINHISKFLGSSGTCESRYMKIDHTNIQWCFPL